MNKSQLVESMADKLETDNKTAEDALTAFLDTLTEVLKAGDKVNIIGFGTFEIRERAARKGMNPQTGEEIEIKATKSPALKVSKTYRNLFND